MKDNVHDIKDRKKVEKKSEKTAEKGKKTVKKGKSEEEKVYIPRFIRELRTPHSERYSIIMGENFELIGTLDLHINEVIQATMVVIPDVEQEALELLVGLAKMELLMPLELDIESFNVFKGVSDYIPLEDEAFYEDDDDFDFFDDDDDFD